MNTIILRIIGGGLLVLAATLGAGTVQAQESPAPVGSATPAPVPEVTPSPGGPGSVEPSPITTVEPSPTPSPSPAGEKMEERPIKSPEGD